MAAAVSQSRRGIVAINITPMVDIILVLLVIFMVTSSAIHANKSIEVDKPQAASGHADADAPTLTITCDARGSYFEDDTALDDAALSQRARAAKLANDDVQAILRCDGSAEVERLVHLIDLLRLAGITRYAVATEPVDEAAPRE